MKVCLTFFEFQIIVCHLPNTTRLLKFSNDISLNEEEMRQLFAANLIHTYFGMERNWTRELFFQDGGRHKGDHLGPQKDQTSIANKQVVVKIFEIIPILHLLTFPIWNLVITLGSQFSH